MTAVSHFQRFSQRENHATNNTLLVLRHLYQTAPAKLEAVLHDLLGDTQIAIGVQFDQQIRGVRSVPDGHIYQRPWSIFVETKLGNDLGEDQIERHIESIAAKKDVGASVLLGLTSGTPDRLREERMADLARKHNVTFKWTTFRELTDALGKQCHAQRRGICYRSQRRCAEPTSRLATRFVSAGRVRADQHIPEAPGRTLPPRAACMIAEPPTRRAHPRGQTPNAGLKGCQLGVVC